MPNIWDVLPYYSLFPAHVLALFLANDQVWDCYKSPDCLEPSSNSSSMSHDLPATTLNPLALIPLHKMFTLSFWTHPDHPLGAPFTLSPEDYRWLGRSENTYLGYSIEHHCTGPNSQFIPHSQRPVGRVWVLAKRISYFILRQRAPWPFSFYKAAISSLSSLGVNFQAGAYPDQDWADERDLGPLPNLTEIGVNNIGLVDRDKFLGVVAQARVLLGIGSPLM